MTITVSNVLKNCNNNTGTHLRYPKKFNHVNSVIIISRKHANNIFPPIPPVITLSLMYTWISVTWKLFTCEDESSEGVHESSLDNLC